MRAEIIYTLYRDAYADAQIDAIEAARARKADARRQETERLIAAVHAERMADVERIAGMYERLNWENLS